MNNQFKSQSLWLVSREYAGIAEAGGVKNVVKSLADAAYTAGNAVTVFLPRYGSCTVELDTVLGSSSICVQQTVHEVRFFEKYIGGIRFVFVDAEIFTEKKDIYTYNSEEIDFFRKKLNRPDLKKGEGYVDSHEMNILFQKAVYTFAVQENSAPEILHCHDAHTALLPAFIGTDDAASALFHNTKKIITIHNAGDGYRQTIYSFSYAESLTGLPASVLGAGCIDDCVEPFLVSAPFAQVTTVSPWYAEQLLQPEQSPYSYRFSEALVDKNIKITGITNGIDYESYNPNDTAVSQLPFAFDIQNKDFAGKYACRSFLLNELKKSGQEELPHTGVQWFGSFSETAEKKYLYLMYHGRFVHQKGIEVLLNAFSLLLEKNLPVRVLIMGQGSADFENSAIALTERFSGSCLYCKGYNRSAARLITAAADFIVLPSLFEPCGLEDLIAQIYGTIPIAHAQGGLQKIIHEKTGILYTVPENAGQDIGLHRDVIVNTVLKYCIPFFDSEYERAADMPFFNDMIMHAQSLLKTQFSWQTVFAEYCRKLYN